jgi:hypothetical protein
VEIKASFEVTAWEEGDFDAESGSQRVTVRKAFRGEVEGTSVAQVLTARENGYVASELFTGSIAGRSGTVRFQHGGIHDGTTGFSFGNIVPLTGTGELEGLRGTAELTRHDDGSHTIRLDLEDQGTR